MAKPWARYQVNFINHDKFRAISANAIGLWLEGKNYADDKLTDGYLPIYEVKHWRFYSRKSVEQLTTSAGLRPGTDVPYHPLWELVMLGEVAYYRMHDYLDHNECRDTVLKRIAQGAAAKEADKDRKAKARAAKKTGQTTGQTTGHSSDVRPPVRENPQMSGSIQISDLRTQEHSLERATGVTRPVTTLETDDIAERAGRLVERYAEWFQRDRGGARYRPRPNLDWMDACALVKIWDDTRLEKLARLVLTTDDPWISRTDRGFRVFALKASWADQKLVEWEAKHGAVA